MTSFERAHHVFRNRCEASSTMWSPHAGCLAKAETEDEMWPDVGWQKYQRKKMSQVRKQARDLEESDPRDRKPLDD